MDISEETERARHTREEGVASAVAGRWRPVISVVVPTRDRGPLLSRALASILHQTRPDFEVVVVDDGSTDNTKDVVEGCADPRVRYVWQSSAGAAAARNTGVAASSGPYITFLDSDDEVTPEWLETLVRGFEEHGADIVCCGLVKDWSAVRATDTETVMLPQRMGALLDNHVGLFLGGTFSLRREIFEELGGYVVGLPSGHHTELSFRLLPQVAARGWRIHNEMKPLVRVHVHSGDRVRSNWSAVLEGTQYLLEAHADRYNQSPRSLSRACGVAGVAAVRIGDVALARKYFWRAATARPSEPLCWLRYCVSLVPPVAKLVWRAGA